MPRLLVLEPVHLGQLQLRRPYLLDDGSCSNTEAPVIPHRDEQAFEPVLAVQHLHLVGMYGFTTRSGCSLNSLPSTGGVSVVILHPSEVNPLSLSLTIPALSRVER